MHSRALVALAVALLVAAPAWAEPPAEATAALDALYSTLGFSGADGYLARVIHDPVTPVPGVTAVIARVFVANPAQSFVAWLYWWRSDNAIPGGHPGTFTQYSLPGKGEAVSAADLSPLVEVVPKPPCKGGVGAGTPLCR